eukprot:GHVU01102806.1.p1 GENE.GHVU01102806.1~~GHVU01102806.1.p1  ORF type:complete len:142 (+),score=0.39 GHVU01102806.1:699-1124(+)
MNRETNGQTKKSKHSDDKSKTVADHDGYSSMNTAMTLPDSGNRPPSLQMQSLSYSKTFQGTCLPVFSTSESYTGSYDCRRSCVEGLPQRGSEVTQLPRPRGHRGNCVTSLFQGVTHCLPCSHTGKNIRMRTQVFSIGPNFL